MSQIRRWIWFALIALVVCGTQGAAFGENYLKEQGVPTGGLTVKITGGQESDRYEFRIFSGTFAMGQFTRSPTTPRIQSETVPAYITAPGGNQQYTHDEFPIPSTDPDALVDGDWYEIEYYKWENGQFVFKEVHLFQFDP
jgi:hypothetical protein